MSKPKFAHNVFQTANHEAMRDWYCTVLDAHVVYEDALAIPDLRRRASHRANTAESIPGQDGHLLLCTTQPTPSTASTRCWALYSAWR